MRLPKLKGFKNPFKVEYQVVNLDRINELFPDGGEVTVETLVAKGAVRQGAPVKVLGQGEISVAVQVSAARVLGAGQGEDRRRRRHRQPALSPAHPPRCRPVRLPTGSGGARLVPGRPGDASFGPRPWERGAPC